MEIKNTMKLINNLIYDIGLHKGEDTSYYLKKGFKVIAFEADPELVLECKNKFYQEIKNKKLIIIEGAIVDKERLLDETIKFYKNLEITVWGTIKKEWMLRNKNLGTNSLEIEVPTVNISKCYKKYGIPHYLKVDIEGADLICLEALLEFKDKPNYISIESEKVNYNNIVKEFKIFEELGYSKFQIINQQRINRLKERQNTNEGKFLNYKFKIGSSGPFGDDFETPWINKKNALLKYKLIFLMYKIWGDDSKIKNYLVVRIIEKIIIRIVGFRIPGWYDTHAKKTVVY